jgi:UDP-N-acetylglucosamine--N-acetylmuramyl-(pentapeptide) pyrophosphoryl-undecaprenol N-acetylglucosamine transferase
MMNKIIFAAGGTGGHIYPAIAIADELKKLKEDIKILFVGASGRIEEKIVPLNGYELKTIDISGFKRSFSLKNLSVLNKLYKAINQSKLIINKFRPDVIYGTGGFVSGPVLWAAFRSSTSSVIQNGDYFPGFTTRLVASRVDKVILNFRESAKFFKKKGNLEYYSYPVRQNLKHYSKEEALDFFYMEKNKRTLLLTGGSQGASSINSAMLKVYKKLVENNIQIIWQTGGSDYDKIKNEVGENKSCMILQYIDQMHIAYSAADLILCRSGISTIMELASFGLPAIFVPYPFAAANHQELNARRIVDGNASVMILDKDLDSELFNKINEVINDNKKLVNYRDNIKKFADNTAANKIANFLLNNF